MRAPSENHPFGQYPSRDLAGYDNCLVGQDTRTYGIDDLTCACPVSKPRRRVIGSLSLLLCDNCGYFTSEDRKPDILAALEAEIRGLRLVAEALAKQAHREIPRRDRASRGFLRLLPEED